jgi:hypothetical protein
MNAKQAWATLGAGILVYELLCDEGELLSEQCDRWLISHPVTTRVAVVSLALHLINALPPKYDIISLGFLGIRKGSRWRRKSTRPI